MPLKGLIIRVKQIFMVGYESVVMHLNDNKLKKEYLVYCNLRGDRIKYYLKSWASVEQLSKHEFIVLNDKDSSVDKVTFTNNQWITSCVRPPPKY